ncbi:hypothetical protein [Streptomyces sp. NPDC051776]|uniref:hypothetical protein n=1 Tax=Streptomyces sp. NPDC051776 TaxID=3155414 RepID=UPI003431389A
MEERLAADYAQLLARVSACARAVANGDWTLAEIRANELARAALALEETVGMIGAASGVVASRTVIEEVLERSGADPVVRALHRPAGPDL